MFIFCKWVLPDSSSDWVSTSFTGQRTQSVYPWKYHKQGSYSHKLARLLMISGRKIFLAGPNTRDAATLKAALAT